MKPDFDAILDECLQRLNAGESVEACLAEYPDQTEELSLLLAAAAFVAGVPAPRARQSAYLAGQQRMLQASRQLPAVLAPAVQGQKEEFHKQGVSFHPLLRYVGRVGDFLKILLIGKDTQKMKLALRLAIDLMILLVIGSAVTLNASASSLPGDPTYTLKRTWEQVRLTLTLDEQARDRLEAQLAEERREEIQTLLRLGRQERVEFSGVLERMEGDEWTAGGLAFRRTGDTIVEGRPGIGQFVRVLARVQQDGALLALRVRLEVGPGPQPEAPGLVPSPGGTQTRDREQLRTQEPGQNCDPERDCEPVRTGQPAGGLGPGSPTEAPYRSTPAGEPQNQGDPQHQPDPKRNTGQQQPTPAQQGEPQQGEPQQGEPQHQPAPAQQGEPEPQPTPAQQGEPQPQPTPAQQSEPHHDPGSGCPTEPPQHGGKEHGGH